MKTISYEKFLQLEGLLTLARGTMKTLGDLERAAAEITGEEEDYGYFGHTSDAVSEGYTASELLRKLDIEVVREASQA